MSISRRNILKSIALGVPTLHGIPFLGNDIKKTTINIPSIDKGPFEGTRESLRKYEIPQWFREAKFGIWAHWGPQSAVEAGDWYARNMYMQGSNQYKHHVKNYGHPSKFGFKDTIPAWKAENFDADHLMSLYKKAGAQYFMSMGVHHDNFDLWNSKYNHWNAVNMGPKKDIVATWKKAAQKHGLKFGISDHLWITYKWYSTSKGSDQDGPLKGVLYDGANPQNFDYYGTCDEVHNNLDWNENGIPEFWKKHWFDRIKDLIDQYEPDLLYCDGHVPFEEYGLNLLAHLYNKTAAKNSGNSQAVYTSKRAADSAPGTGICVFDVERGVVNDIWPLPWQTDTCIGDWHYNRDRVGRYKSVKIVIDMLVDIVSRNGNLMLNFPLPASGMPDNDELTILDGITKWMAVNSEGIYATKPWKIYGEGPMSSNNEKAYSEQQFNEQNRKGLTYEDIRFTTKNETLYAFFMGWPETNAKKIVIHSLATNSIFQTGHVDHVELLGVGSLNFIRDEKGLQIQLPEKKPGGHAFTLKIEGRDLI